MKKYHIPKEQFSYTFDPTTTPVLRVAPPCVIDFETDDLGYRRLFQGETIQDIGSQNLNMVTGPVYIEGAEVGDAIKIDVLKIQIKSAWSVWVPGFGALGNFTTEQQIHPIHLENGYARISDALRVKVEPMIGCIGLAPAIGSSSTISPTFAWGGNMDLRELSPHASIYLPVQTPGGLLSVGDLHAAMGSGEPTWISLESAGVASLQISLEKHLELKSPRLRVGTETLILGQGKSYPEAIQSAYDQVFEHLIHQCGLLPFDAYAYASARVGLRFAGPAGYNVLAVIPDFDEKL